MKLHLTVPLSSSSSFSSSSPDVAPEGSSAGAQEEQAAAAHHSITPLLHRPRLITLGAYGFTEAAFFTALRDSAVDTFCDIRARRGVRGREYSFVNSKRLQARLAELGIRYLHVKELAPSKALRERQSVADKAEHVAKRQRAELSEMFVIGYRDQCLQDFDSKKFIAHLGDAARVVALFCVERTPAACHRSLVAERLQHDLGLEVAHLMPP